MSKDNGISMWVDENLTHIIIGYDSTKPGQNYLTVPATQDAVLAWVAGLIQMLNDGEIVDLPGTVETQVEQENESAKDEICAKIQEIMETYREGKASTPGGLEHMGDVWRLFAKWDISLREEDKS